MHNCAHRTACTTTARKVRFGRTGHVGDDRVDVGDDSLLVQWPFEDPPATPYVGNKAS